MPLRGEEDHDGQPAPLDVGVEMAEEGVLLACGDERIDSTVASVRLVVDAADLGRLALVVGPVLPASDAAPSSATGRRLAGGLPLVPDVGSLLLVPLAVGELDRDAPCAS